MGQIVGAIFLAAGGLMLVRPDVVREYIAKRALWQRDTARQTADWFWRIMGVVFVVVGALAISGNWPPG